MKMMQRKTVSIPGHISSNFEILSFFNGGYGLNVVTFFMEGWAIEEEPKSNTSPSVELIPKFRKPKIKPNPLAISIGSLESNVH